MSEKRIFIREVENPCADCENKGCNVCNCGEIWQAAIPRDEAVERMAKGIFTEIWGLPNNRFNLAKSSVRIRNRKLAQAALAALLEEVR